VRFLLMLHLNMNRCDLRHRRIIQNTNSTEQQHVVPTHILVERIDPWRQQELAEHISDSIYTVSC
jgi:hypothetical protein